MRYAHGPGTGYNPAMMKHIGQIRELVRYPIKSMAGIPTESAFLGWHGLAGDRRFAFQRLGDVGGFPWVRASRLPELLLYHPTGLDESSGEPVPTHVRTPAGSLLELSSEELAREIAERCGNGVQLMKLRHGIFDDASISLISRATIAWIGREAGMDLDDRRFRANILLDTSNPEPFEENGWVAGRLVFGESEPRPAVSVTLRDKRCKVINMDPDTGTQDPRVMQAVMQLNTNYAGVYGTVVQTGTIRVGDPVSLVLDTPRENR